MYVTRLAARLPKHFEPHEVYEMTRSSKAILHYLTEGANRARFQICRPNRDRSPTHIRATGGHTGTTEVSIDTKWRVPDDVKYLHHSTFSTHVDSIAWNGIVPGGLNQESGRHDIFLSVLDLSDRHCTE